MSEVRVDTIAIGTRVDTQGFEQGAKKSEGILAKIGQGFAGAAHFAAGLAKGALVAYGLKKALEAASGAAKTFGLAQAGMIGNIAKLVTAFLGFKVALAAFSGILAGAAALGIGGALVHSAAAAIDQQSKLAERIGATTQATVGLSHAANLAGVEQEALTKGVQKLGVNLAKAQDQGNATSGIFRELGLSAKELAGVDRVEAIGKISDALNKIQNPAERSRIAVELFGKSGAQLGNLLALGSEGLRAMAEDADRLGITFTRAQGRGIEETNDAWQRVGEAIRGVGSTLAITIAPFSAGMANFAAGTVSALNDVIRPFGILIELGSKLVGAVFTPLTWAADLAGKALHAMSRAFEGAVNWIMETTGLSNGAEKALGALDNESEEGAKKIAEYTAHLEEQIATFGKAAGEVDVYRARMAGATSIEINHLRVLQDKLAAMKAQEEATKKAKQAQDEIAKSAADFTEGLHKQVATFGMGSTAAQLWEQQRKGATEAQLAEARVWATQLDQLNAHQDAVKNAAEAQKQSANDRAKAEEDAAKRTLAVWQKTIDQARGVFEATRTPAEQMAERVRQITALFDADKINPETFKRSLLQAQNQFGDSPGLTSFAEKGSQEARSRILKWQQSGGQNKLNENTLKIVEQEREVNKKLDVINTTLATGLAVSTII